MGPPQIEIKLNIDPEKLKNFKELWKELERRTQMGTDIHCYVEVLDETPDAMETVLQVKKWNALVKGTKDKMIPEPFCTDRNYDVFAVLADVRNGSGFAGCNTGDPLPVISEPRGIPEDVSPEIANLSEEYGPDGHSHSWLTLEEILNFDWTQTQVKRGIIDIPVYKKWKASKSKQPESFCSGTSAPVITEKQYLKLSPAKKKALEAGDRTTIKCEWKVPIEENCHYFIDEIKDLAQHLSWEHFNDGTKLKEVYKRVRLIFWFDN